MVKAEPKFRRVALRQNFHGVRFELLVEFNPTPGSWTTRHTNRLKRLGELRKQYHLLHTTRPLAETAAFAISKLPDVEHVTVWKLERTRVAMFNEQGDAEAKGLKAEGFLPEIESW